MSLWKQYKEQDIDCDKLQRIHTLENLASLLKGDGRGLKAGDDADDLMAEVSDWLPHSFGLLCWCCRQKLYIWSTLRRQMTIPELLLKS